MIAKSMVNQAGKEISFDFFLNEVLHYTLRPQRIEVKISKKTLETLWEQPIKRVPTLLRKEPEGLKFD